MNRRSTTLTLTALACCMIASAQTTSGSVRGVASAKDGQGRVAGSATARNQETGFTRSVALEANGSFSLTLLPTGTYQVRVNAPGFRSAESRVKVNLGETAVLNMALERDVASATVEVISTSSSIDTKQVNVMTSVDAALVEAVPLVTRNFTDMARLSPGVVAGSNNKLVVEGGRQIFNAIQIDGASTNSAFFNEQRGGAYTPYIFGADTIKELQVVTNGFDVQYAQAGATVNAITKNGTNELAGSALYQVRRTSLSAKPKAIPYDPTGSFNTPTNLQRFNDSTNINFNVGGPIIKDKLWYYAGVERYNKSITANPIPTLVSSAAGMTQTDFNNMLASSLGQVRTNAKGLTLAQEMGNPGLGTPANAYPAENTNTVYFGRLDYAYSPDHRLVFRVNYQAMTDTLVNQVLNNAESNLLLTKTNSISWVVESNDIWSNELFTESRLQAAREARPMRANSVPGTPSIEVPTSASPMAFGTKTSSPRESNENTLGFYSATTWNRGDWQVKGGVDLSKVDVDNQFFQNNSGRLRFGTYGAAAAWANGTLAAVASPTDPGGAVIYDGAVSPFKGRIQMWTRNESAFGQVQYSGLFDKRLTLTAGLRSMKQSFSDNPAPNPNFKGLDQGMGASAIDPRLAFSYDLDGKGKTVIRGGYGTFTSPTPLLLHSNTMTGNGQIITNYSLGLSRTGAAVNLGTYNTGLLSATNLISGSTMRHLTDTELAALPAVTSSTSLWDPSNKLSRSKKTSVGVEHDLGNNLVLGLTATYVKYENLQRFENINLNQGNVATPTPYNDGYASNINVWGTAVRPNTAIIRGRSVDFNKGSITPGNPVGGFSDVYLVKTDGKGYYRGLSFTAKKTWDEKTGLLANVTYAKAQDTGSFERGTYGSNNGNFSGELGASVTPDPQDAGSNFGYGDSDRRWVANVVAYFPIIWGIEGSVRGLYQSGLPYSAYLFNDANGDGIINSFAPGHTRNDQRQPGYTQIDLRLSRNFKIYGKLDVEGIIDIYNLLNRAEYFVTSPTGNYLNAAISPSNPTGMNAGFGQLGNVSKDRTRELQLGIRVKF